jgi:N-acetylglucosaminyldiphosphoundecaprenol N-acetyl-beta-D-mannosaminyltransferase
MQDGSAGAHADIARVNILGVHVSAITPQSATSVLQAWIRNRTLSYVCVTGVHGVMESFRDLELRDIHNKAGLVTPDGMPLVWMSHRLGFPHVRRVYGPDLMRDMTALSAEHGYRNFYYGGTDGTPERLRDVLTRRHPGLQVVGTLSPPFRLLTRAEDDTIVQQINTASPDIVWVGLSTPKQEQWMAEHRSRLHAPVLIGVGAAFDFLSEQKPQAPPWMQRSGLEWLFRMALEPRRLGLRYLRNNPTFIYEATRQIASKSRYAGQSNSEAIPPRR